MHVIPYFYNYIYIRIQNLCFIGMEEGFLVGPSESLMLRMAVKKLRKFQVG